MVFLDTFESFLKERERTLIMNAPRGGGGVGQMQSIEFRGEGGCWAGEFERILSPVIEAILGQRSFAFRWQMYIYLSILSLQLTFAS